MNSVSAIDLLTAMGMAADRDRVARQYVTGFADVLEIGRPLLQEITRAAGQSPDRVIIDGEISSRFAAHPSLGSSDDIRLLSHQDPHRFDRIIQLHLEYLSRWPDSLIARKCGPSLADERGGELRWLSRRAGP